MQALSPLAMPAPRAQAPRFGGPQQVQKILNRDSSMEIMDKLEGLQTLEAMKTREFKAWLALTNLLSNYDALPSGQSNLSGLIAEGRDDLEAALLNRLTTRKMDPLRLRAFSKQYDAKSDALKAVLANERADGKGEFYG